MLSLGFRLLAEIFHRHCVIILVVFSFKRCLEEVEEMMPTYVWQSSRESVLFWEAAVGLCEHDDTTKIHIDGTGCRAGVRADFDEDFTTKTDRET